MPDSKKNNTPDKRRPSATRRQTEKNLDKNSRAPVLANSGLRTLPGDNTKFLNVQIELINMPDIDMKDAKAVQQRINDYLELYARNDMKPTVVGMALSLNGMNRQTLWAIAHDKPLGGSGVKTSLPSETADVIKRNYILLENLWESYMNSGKVNPVSGIFLGKNHYGYQDKTEYVVTPNVGGEQGYDAKDIRSRYLADVEE